MYNISVYFVVVVVEYATCHSIYMVYALVRLNRLRPDRGLLDCVRGANDAEINFVLDLMIQPDRDSKIEREREQSNLNRYMFGHI